MSVHLAERRCYVRLPASHPVTVWDRRGRLRSRTRTSDISPNGRLLLLPAEKADKVPEWLVVRVSLPAISFGNHGGRGTRSVRYNARVVHREPTGQLVSVGLELLGKVG